MWYKVNKRYVGTNLVRPSEITQTYTIAAPTTSNVDTSVYKSWYKITKVVASLNVYPSSTNTVAWISTNIINNPTLNYIIWSYIDLGYSATSQNRSYSLKPQKNWTSLESYQGTDLWYANTNTNITYTMTASNITVKYGTNTYTRTWNANTQQMIQEIFESNNPCFRIRRDNNWQASNITVTVTYSLA